jgi:hypothetical protein
MGLLFIAALLLVMTAFAGYHFVVGLFVVGIGAILSKLIAKAIFAITGAPTSRQL